MYDSDLNLATGRFALYTINSDVTIKGGYPAKPSEGTASDPSKYKATFSGDFREDDSYTLLTNASGAYFLDVKNTEDNSTILFLVRPSVK